MSTAIRNSVFNLREGIGIAGGQWWGGLYFTLSSGSVRYKREINNTGGYFVLYYSNDSGSIWDTLFTLDLTEDNVIIDLTHLYRHRIVGTAYHVDRTLTSTGYSGTENLDWENIYST
jgi:hypothetical protein